MIMSYLTTIVVVFMVTSTVIIADDPCRFTHESGTIDLTSLGRTDGQAKYKGVELQPQSEYSYSYNPCYTFTDGEICKNVSVCRNGKNTADQRVLGMQENPRWDVNSDPENSASILYHFGEAVMARVILVCSRNNTDKFEVLTEDSEGSYIFRLTNLCACWDGCSKNTSTTAFTTTSSDTPASTSTESTTTSSETPAPTSTESTATSSETPAPTSTESTTTSSETPASTSTESTTTSSETPAPTSTESTATSSETPAPTSTESTATSSETPAPTSTESTATSSGTPAPTPTESTITSPDTTNSSEASTLTLTDKTTTRSPAPSSGNTISRVAVLLAVLFVLLRIY